MQMFFHKLTGHKAQHGSQQQQSVSNENNVAVEQPSRGDQHGNPAPHRPEDTLQSFPAPTDYLIMSRKFIQIPSPTLKEAAPPFSMFNVD